MKITKISLQNFRAFDEPFELDLDGGKNLLLHGENGSGKSSIYFALKRFFEERGDDIAKHKNQFAPAIRESYVRVHIKGTDASKTEYDNDFWWDDNDAHPLPVPKDPATAPITKELRSLLVDAARRAGFVDYRAMLRTHLLTKPLSRSNRGPTNHDIIYGTETAGLDAQLFDLVSMVVLAGVPVTISGGSETTLGALIRKVWENRPHGRYKTVLNYRCCRRSICERARGVFCPQSSRVPRTMYFLLSIFPSEAPLLKEQERRHQTHSEKNARHALYFRAAQAGEIRLKTERKRPNGRLVNYILSEKIFEIA
jgi:energy-coupling factor transporter ATP-binding protein EcfA2